MSFFAVGTAVVMAAGSAQQANDIRDAATFNKDMNNFNAQNADLDAFHAEQEGQTDASRYQESIDKVAGEQKADFASEGVDTTFGTAKEVQQDTKVAGALNILDIRNRAHQKALGYTQQGMNLREQGLSSMIGANYSADATAASGFANAAGTGYRGLSGYGRLPDKP